MKKSEEQKYTSKVSPVQIDLDTADKYNFEPDEILRTIQSKHGYPISIHDDKNWLCKISFFVPGLETKILRLPKLINEHPLIEYSARYFLLEQLSRVTTIRGLARLCKLLGNLEIPLCASRSRVKTLITEWIYVTSANLKPNDETTFTALRNYIRFCVEHEYWAFDEELGWQIETMSFQKKRKKLAGFNEAMLDPSNGPYTQTEVMLISNALEQGLVSLEEYILITICRDLALRPVQIALLREEDFISDLRGSYLKVPRVKGFQRSALRRTSNNFTERAISDSLAQKIKKLILQNEVLFQRIRNELPDTGPISVQADSLPRPLFPTKRISERQLKIFLNSRTRDYTYHATNLMISNIIISTTSKLSIQRNTNMHEIDELAIGAYRFRRTKATSMVLQGYSPQEIAYTLDHSNTMSVSHYFRFSKDVIDFVNSATSTSPEIITMRNYWEGRLIDVHEPGPKEVKLTRIASLGVCMKEGDCEFHPTVTCYGCKKFKAYKDGHHKEAYENIIHIQKSIAEDSSGPIRTQLSLAASMALQCVNEVEKEYV